MEYIKVGVIATTKGLKGEVRIKSLTNMQEDRFKPGNKIFLIENNNYLELTIKSHAIHKNQDVLVFKGYEDINKIEKYKGYDLFVPIDQEVFLDENEFFIEELIGLKVYQGEVYKGEVVDIVTYPQGDYLVVEIETGDKLVPFRDEFIETQDEEKISVVEMEGLLWK